MAFTKYTKDTKIIGALGTNPAERGLTTQEFKDKFDQFATEFVEWFNATHVVEADAHLADTAMHNNNGQLTFPATQNPSSNPNVLDDYEEGTWTPVINRLYTPSEVTYTWQSGDYVKIGRLVFINAYITISEVTTAGSGLNQVKGLPFQPVGTAYQNTGAVFYNSIFSTSTAMSVSPHTDNNCLYFKDATRGQSPMNVNWEAGHLSFCLVYLTY